MISTLKCVLGQGKSLCGMRLITALLGALMLDP
jgi:hypothetical protein